MRQELQADSEPLYSGLYMCMYVVYITMCRLTAELSCTV
jgi:hypothetical protein